MRSQDNLQKAWLGPVFMVGKKDQARERRQGEAGLARKRAWLECSAKFASGDLGGGEARKAGLEKAGPRPEDADWAVLVRERGYNQLWGRTLEDIWLLARTGAWLMRMVTPIRLGLGGDRSRCWAREDGSDGGAGRARVAVQAGKDPGRTPAAGGTGGPRTRTEAGRCGGGSGRRLGGLLTAR